MYHDIEKAKSLIELKHWKFKIGMPLLYSRTCRMYCSDLPPYLIGDSAGFLLVRTTKDYLRAEKDCTSKKSGLFVPDLNHPSMIGYMLQLIAEALDRSAEENAADLDRSVVGNIYCSCHKGKIWRVWIRLSDDDVVQLNNSKDGEDHYSRMDALICALKNIKE